MKRKKTAHALAFMLSFAWDNKKSYLVYLAGEQLFYYLAALVGMAAPKSIMNYLFETPQPGRFCAVVAGYVAAVTLCRSMAQLMRVNVYVSSYALNQCFSLYIGDATSKIAFANAEDSMTAQLHDRAIGCVYHNGFFGPLEEVVTLAREAVTLFSMAFILFRAVPAVLLLCVLAAAVNFGVNLLANKRKYGYEKQKTEWNRKYRYISSVFSDFSYGMEIRINNLFGWLQEKMEENYKVLREINGRIQFFVLLSDDVRGVTSAVQHVGLYLLLALEVLSKGLGLGSFTLYFNAVNQFSNSLGLLLKGYVSLNEMGLYIDDLEEFFRLPKMDRERDEYPAVPEGPAEIVFEEVSFRYPGQEAYALRHVNLRLEAGERIDIVGLNGAGKSTMVKLLLRLYEPTEGRILYCGRDIREFRYDDYIKKFSVVFQDFKLLAFSVRDNICFGREVDDRRMWDAMEKSGLGEVVRKLPLKEDMPLYKVYDENGVEFSGGEAQKLAVARALYKDSPIMVLDEPASALDPLSENEMYRELDSLGQGKMMLCISHRLSGTRFSHRIIVFAHGEIVEEGKHEELMELGGLYAEMYRKQAEKYLGV